MVALPVTLEFCTLAAVMVTLPAIEGAVKAPLEVMEPVVADQVTAEL